MRSSGLLLYRHHPALEVWIGHMGGPFWAKRDAAAWSIPKGEVAEGEADLAGALREFAEEMGHPAPEVDWVLLGEFVQPSRKVVVVFTAESDFAVDSVTSNLFELEWPPRSGRLQRFPEIDNARWFSVEDARGRVLKGQVPMLDALAEKVAGQT
jgi:predicted NUDIX family NTP pyrophosphohydrolase